MKMSKPKRLHPVTIFILFFSSVRELFIPMIAAFFFGKGAETSDVPYTIYYLVGAFIILSLYGYLKWVTFTYEVSSDELKIKQGIFIKKYRFIRRERIYSIDITAGVLQRLFHLVAIKVETAGGGNEPEVVLTAVTKQEAILIREQLLDGHKIDETNEGNLQKVTMLKVKNQWRLSNKNLFLAALTSNGIGIAFITILTLAIQLEEWLPSQYLENSFEFLFDYIIFFSIIILVIILFLSWFISITATFLKYGNFNIEKQGDVLQITRGILKKRQLTLSVTRITAIRVVESILRQPFGFATVYVESAGGGSMDEQLSTVLFPLVRKKDLNKHLQEVIPLFAFEQPIKKLPKRAKTRYVLRMCVPGIIIAGLISFFIPYGFVGAIIFLGSAFFLGNQQYKDAGFGKNDRFLWISSRAISKMLVIIPKHRIQALEIKQSFLQNLRALFTIQASILTSIVGKSFRCVNVSEKQKEEMLAWYSFEEI